MNFLSVCVCVSICVSVWYKNYISTSDRFVKCKSTRPFVNFFFIFLLLLFTICCCFRSHCCRNGTVVGPTATCKHSKDVDRRESHQSSSINIRINILAFSLNFTVTFTVTVSITVNFIIILIYGSYNVYHLKYQKWMELCDSSYYTHCILYISSYICIYNCYI